MKDIGKTKDYPKEIYRLLSEIEPKHSWFWAKNKIIEEVIRKYGGNPVNKSFFEVGCGTGYVLSHLEKMGMRVTGMDIYKQGLSYAQERTKKARLICGDIREYKDREKYDMVGLFDLIEHLADDEKIIKISSGFLKKNGLLFLTVPSCMPLFSYIDIISGHKKRYTRSEIIKLLQKANLEPIYIEYMHFFILPVSYLYNKMMTRKYTGDKNRMKVFREYFRSRIIFNYVFKIIYYIERILGKFISYPCGTSLIAVAQKK